MAIESVRVTCWEHNSHSPVGSVKEFRFDVDGEIRFKWLKLVALERISFVFRSCVVEIWEPTKDPLFEKD